MLRYKKLVIINFEKILLLVLSKSINVIIFIFSGNLNWSWCPTQPCPNIKFVLQFLYFYYIILI